MKTKNDYITINGLMDGISVLEKDNIQEQPTTLEDTIFNCKEPFNLQFVEETSFKISE